MVFLDAHQASTGFYVQILRVRTDSVILFIIKFDVDGKITNNARKTSTTVSQSFDADSKINNNEYPKVVIMVNRTDKNINSYA